MIKYIAWGALAGLLLVLASHGIIMMLGIALFVLIVVSMMDWSGEGDGREGCNRHTSCNHNH
jgi:hypothetical protein